MGKIIEVKNPDKNIYFSSFCKFTEVESKVDRKIGELLEEDFGENCVFQQKVEKSTVISREYADKVNRLFPSKGSGNNNGRPDFIVITNEKNSRIDIIADNKNSNVDINTGIEDAIGYADAVIKKGFNSRIVLASNGIDCLLRVYDLENKQWVPFKINGIEVNGIPKKKLVELVYNEDAVGIKTDLSNKKYNSQIINSVLDELEEIYYSKYKDLVHNKNNQKKIDFTIALVVLKTLLEKNRNIFMESDLSEDIEILYSESKTTYTNSDSKKIKKAILACLTIIFNDENQYDEYVDELKVYRDVFEIRDEKNKNKVLFKFKNIIEDIGKIDNRKKKTLLADIYKQINRLENLHDSDIDLFGEIYEKLMNNKTKKDFGQFFTKRNLTRVLGRILFKQDIVLLVNEFLEGMNEEFKNDKFQKVLVDFACGTGGLIIEPVHLAKSELKYGNALDKFIKKNNLDSKKKNEYIDKILKEFSSSCIYAGDIAGENIARTKVNMFFAGDGFSNVKEVDSLNDDELNELLKRKKIDYLITNVPMGSKTDEIIKDNEKIISNKKISENQFLIQSVKYLKNGTGKAMIILPDGIFEGTDNYELREWLLKNCKINYIIGFPKYSFAPYTHEKTYALFIEKRNAKLEYLVNEDEANESKRINPTLSGERGIYMYIVDCDGMANSDKRFLTKEKDNEGKWLHDELSEWYDISGKCKKSILEECCEKLEEKQPKTTLIVDEWNRKIEGQKYGIIKFEDILRDKILTKGKLIKEVELSIELLKQVGLFCDKDYSEKELITMYNKSVNYITDALYANGLHIDKITTSKYYVYKENKKINKKEFKHLLENEVVFGLSRYKINYNFEKSGKIEVIDLNSNKALDENKVLKALKIEGITIDKESKEGKTQFILDDNNEKISSDILNSLNKWIRLNNINYKVKVPSETIREFFNNQKDEDKIELLMSAILELNYEIDEDNDYKIYELCEKRIINLLPENYLRPAKLPKIEYTKFRKKVSEIIGNIDVKSILYEEDVKNIEESIKTYKEKLKDLEELLASKLVFKDLDEVLVRDIFNLRKGVTINEVDLYNNKGNIPVYSSQTLNNGEFGKCSEEYYNLCRKKGQSNELTWTTNGNAGKVFYRNNNYLFTEKCGQMRLKSRFKKSCNLKFFEIILNQRTMEYLTSKEGNGKLEIQNMANVKIQMPDLNVQENVVKLVNKSRIVQRRLKYIIDELELLEMKQIK